MKQTVTVLGDGAWGTACASLLAHKGYNVKLWCFNPKVAESIKQTGINKIFLPDIQLPEHIIPITNIQEAITNTDVIFEAIPVKFMRTVLVSARKFISNDQKWVILSKGIETKTLLLPTQILEDIFGPTRFAVISGPSFARDLALKHPTGVNISSQDFTIAQEVQKLVDSHYFRSYYTPDYIGCQSTAALKNILAIGVGILDSLSYSDNTKILFLMQALKELEQFTHALGGQRNTVYSLAGIGDIMLTCLGSKSKNLALGKQLGAGLTLEQIEQTTHTISEGPNTAQSFAQLTHKHSLTLPLCMTIHDIIFGIKKPHELVTKLMG